MIECGKQNYLRSVVVPSLSQSDIAVVLSPLARMDRSFCNNGTAA